MLFSALYKPDSVPGRLLGLALEGDLELFFFCPDTARRELEHILSRKLGYTPRQATAILLELSIEWVGPELYGPLMAKALPAIRDPDDAPLVATALLLGADVVSGDKAFHPLRRPVVKTWKPQELSRRLP